MFYGPFFCGTSTKQSPCSPDVEAASCEQTVPRLKTADWKCLVTSACINTINNHRWRMRIFNDQKSPGSPANCTAKCANKLTAATVTHFISVAPSSSSTLLQAIWSSLCVLVSLILDVWRIDISVRNYVRWRHDLPSLAKQQHCQASMQSSGTMCAEEAAAPSKTIL